MIERTSLSITQVATEDAFDNLKLTLKRGDIYVVGPDSKPVPRRELMTLVDPEEFILKGCKERDDLTIHAFSHIDTKDWMFLYTLITEENLRVREIRIPVTAQKFYTGEFIRVRKG